MTYYNDSDPYCCDWLSNLMDAGLITPGKIDDRSIADVSPDDLAGFRRCHFFAGIGGWELALNLAGWPEDAEVWTGSCPCQPFSAAGKRKGTADERHLWPEFRRLIAACRPPYVFGEQVASADGRKWLGGVAIETGGESSQATGHAQYAGVRPEMEALGYSVGAADLCASCAGEEGDGWIVYLDGAVVRERVVLGAPHIRQRLFWGACLLAESERIGVRGEGFGATGATQSGMQGTNGQREWIRTDAGTSGSAVAGILAEPDESGRGAGERNLREGRRQPDAAGNGEACRLGLSASQRDRAPTDAGSDCQGEREGRQRGTGGSGASSELGDTNGPRWNARSTERQERGESRLAMPATRGEVCWSDFDIIPCLDGKSRRVESGSFPLAHGIPRSVGDLLARLEELGIDSKSARGFVQQARRNRTGRLKGLGNAIVPQLAAEFVGAFLEAFSTGHFNQRGK